MSTIIEKLKMLGKGEKLAIRTNEWMARTTIDKELDIEVYRKMGYLRIKNEIIRYKFIGNIENFIVALNDTEALMANISENSDISGIFRVELNNSGFEKIVNIIDSYSFQNFKQVLILGEFPMTLSFSWSIEDTGLLVGKEKKEIKIIEGATLEEFNEWLIEKQFHVKSERKLFSRIVYLKGLHNITNVGFGLIEKRKLVNDKYRIAWKELNRQEWNILKFKTLEMFNDRLISMYCYEMNKKLTKSFKLVILRDNRWEYQR